MPVRNANATTTNSPKAASSLGPFGRVCVIHQRATPILATVQAIQKPTMSKAW